MFSDTNLETVQKKSEPTEEHGENIIPASLPRTKTKESEGLRVAVENAMP